MSTHDATTRAVIDHLAERHDDTLSWAALADLLETATERVRVCTAFMYSHQEMGVECNCDSWRDVKVERPHPILAHLRSPGPHWRGCWAVDLLLEKE